MTALVTLTHDERDSHFDSKQMEARQSSILACEAHEGTGAERNVKSGSTIHLLTKGMLSSTKSHPAKHPSVQLTCAAVAEAIRS